jgi:hypothetical protein
MMPLTISLKEIPYILNRSLRVLWHACPWGTKKTKAELSNSRLRRSQQFRRLLKQLYLPVAQYLQHRRGWPTISLLPLRTRSVTAFCSGYICCPIQPTCIASICCKSTRCGCCKTVIRVTEKDEKKWYILQLCITVHGMTIITRDSANMQ